jgi:hypothetical protein
MFEAEIAVESFVNFAHVSVELLKGGPHHHIVVVTHVTFVLEYCGVFAFDSNVFEAKER